MPLPERVVRGRRVVLPEGVAPAAIHIEGGRISAIAPFDEAPAGAEIVEAGDAAVLPAGVDTHVHVNEPGRAEWEGFGTAGRAAAAGGVTTLVDMPLNSVPATTSAAALEAKRAAAAGRCRVDVGFWGGLVPGNEEALSELVAAGALGFKAFLVDSGVPEFPPVAEAHLRRALPDLAASGAPLLVHAELPGPIERAAARLAGLDPRRYATYLSSRPAAAELEAIELLLTLCRERPFRLHVVHLATPEALPALGRARDEGLPVTVETCPHYLTFAAEEIPDGATEHKCAPPIRSAAEREGLWRGLAAGEIDLVASDHSPAPAALKHRDTGDFVAAWGGISSLQLALAALWTGASRRGHPLADLARWTSAAPARLAGLEDRKGRIAVGLDADLAIFDPEAELEVAPEALFHRHPLTPYAGMRLRGVVRETILRGETIYRDGDFPGPPAGRLLAGRAQAARGAP